MSTPERPEVQLESHCVDCCCARSWDALDGQPIPGASIPEYIIELRAEVDRLKNVEGELRCGKMVLRAELATLRKIAECAVEMREVLGYALSKQGYAATEVLEIFGRFNDPVTRYDDLTKGDLNGRN